MSVPIPATAPDEEPALTALVEAAAGLDINGALSGQPTRPSIDATPAADIKPLAYAVSDATSATGDAGIADPAANPASAQQPHAEAAVTPLSANGGEGGQ